MRNVSDKSCAKNRNTYLVFSYFFRKIVSCTKQCGKKWWSQTGKDDNIIVRWITEASHMCSEYVILIAFPRQQWLRERALIFHYTYVVFLVELYEQRLKDSCACLVDIKKLHLRVCCDNI
jgi:hypothetical protein